MVDILQQTDSDDIETTKKSLNDSKAEVSKQETEEQPTPSEDIKTNW